MPALNNSMSPTDDVPASSNRTNANVNAGIEKQRKEKNNAGIMQNY